MKKALLLLLLVVTGLTTNAQAFLDRLSTTNPGIKGCITWDGAFLKVYGHDDLSNPIKANATFELLNLNSIKDNSSLPTLKLRIIDDNESGSRNGLVGYMYPSLTSLSSLFSYKSYRVEFDYKNMLATSYTGTTGLVTFEGLTLRMNDFNDTYPNLTKGTKLELLNTKMAKTIDCLGLYLAKVKVVDGAHAGKVGYVYASLTTFGDYADYDGGTLNCPKGFIGDGSSSGSSGGSFIDKLSTQNTGITGLVTYEGLTLRMTSFNDVSPNLPNGTKIELLNTNMIQTDDGLGLWCAKVKVLEGSQKGKVGYVYASLTTFGDCADYDNGKITCSKGFTGGSSSSSSSSMSSGDFLNQLSTVNTGCTGLITFEGLLLKTSNWEDGTSLSKGTKIELLSNKMIRSTDSWALNHIKVKVISGPYSGKVGYVYPSSTTFTKYSDYTNQTMYPPKGFTGDDSSSGSSSGSGDSGSSSSGSGSWDLPNYPTERTGISGKVTISTGAYAYEDDGQWLTELKLSENSTFTLLNKQVFHDALNDDFYIKVKVTYDPSGTYTNKTLYITILDTDLSSRFDQSSTAHALTN